MPNASSAQAAACRRSGGFGHRILAVSSVWFQPDTGRYCRAQAVEGGEAHAPGRGRGAFHGM